MTTKKRPKSEPVSLAPVKWRSMPGYEDIVYEKAEDEALAKITINRPECRNAFRPQTVFEMSKAFADARDDSELGVVILTGAGDEAFCSGGDQRVRGAGGYVGKDGIARLNVLDLQRQIRTLPKPVVASVARPLRSSCPEPPKKVEETRLSAPLKMATKVSTPCNVSLYL